MALYDDSSSSVFRRLRRTPPGATRPTPPPLTRCAVLGIVLGALTALASPPKAPPAPPPFTVRNLSVTLDEDTSAQGQLAVVARADEKLTMKLKRWPRHGEATFDAATGSFRYVPAKDFNGDDVFSVQVLSAHHAATATVSLTVAPVDDAPVVSPLSLSTLEDVPARGTVAAKDVDADILTYRLSAPPQHGTATVEPRSGAVTYHPAADYFGTDAFAVEVSDGALSSTSAVSVSVAPVNDAPAVRAQSLDCREDTPCAGRVAASDVDGDPLAYRLTGKPKHGALTLEPSSGAFSYAPAADFNGDDAFSLEVSDGKLKATSTVRLRVAAVNDAPVAGAVALSTPEDTSVSGAVVASDVDGDALGYRISAPAAHGEARVDPRSGALSYAPAANFNGADAFSVEVSDGTAAVSVPVSVAIAAVNDAPVAKQAAHTLDEDTPFAGQCVASDVEGDRLTFRVEQRPRHGELEVDAASGAFKYVPARDYHGPDGFTFAVSDGHLESTALVRLTVQAVNDAPTSEPLALSTNEDTPAYGAVVATDVDADALRYEVSAPAAHGTARVDPRSGAVTYQPAADYNGPDAFTLTVSDGALSSTSHVEVAIAAVDDPPAVHPLTVKLDEDTVAEARLPGSDVDGDPLTFRVVSQPRLGPAVLLDASTGTWRYTPGPNLNGHDELTFTVTDGRSTAQGVVKLEVAPVNDAPAVAALELNTREEKAADGRLVGSDLDGDALTYALAVPPRTGTATVDAATGRVHFTPVQDQNGDASFMVSVSDGHLSSPPAQVVVHIEPVNDPPVASDSALKTDEDTPLEGKLVATDVDGDALVFKVTAPSSHGSVKVLDAAKGTFLYTPSANYFGDDLFTFSVTDPSGTSSQAQVHLAVAPVNDPPVAVASHLIGPCRGSVSGRLEGYDRETKHLTFRIVMEPKVGQVKLVDPRTGDFVFFTDGAELGETTFEFTVSDGELESEPADVTVSVGSLCNG